MLFCLLWEHFLGLSLEGDTCVTSGLLHLAVPSSLSSTFIPDP